MYVCLYVCTYVYVCTTHAIDMFRSSSYGKHAQYTGATPDIKHHLATKQMLIVVHGITISERPYFVLQHLLMYACNVGRVGGGESGGEEHVNKQLGILTGVCDHLP